MNVKPFRGLRPAPRSRREGPEPPVRRPGLRARRGSWLDGDPYTFLHVVKAEIDLDPGLDPYDERVYAKARENFVAMREDGWLVRDAASAVYLYRLPDGRSRPDRRRRRRIGRRLPRPGGSRSTSTPVPTRKTTARVTRTQSVPTRDPVFLAYRDRPTLDALVSEKTRRSPDVEFVAADGVGHALWVVDDPTDVERFESGLTEVPASYIADGHHRAAAYARVARRCAAGTPTGSSPFISPRAS